MLRGPAALAPEPRSWIAGPLAALLTFLFLAIVGGAVAAGRHKVDEARRAERAPAATREIPEHLVYVPTPNVSAPRVPAPSTPSAPRVRRPRAPVRPGGRAAARGGGAPATPTPADSAAGRAPGAAAAPAPTGEARPRIESPRGVFTPAPCGIPCILGGDGAAGGGGVDATAGDAERDSLRRSVGRRGGQGVPGEGGPVIQDPAAAAANGLPSRQSGISLPAGLPGGGPSAAQRRRDSTLNADVSARLARIKARADSVEAARRDSLWRR